MMIGIQVGASKETVAQARALILSILSSDSDEATKQVALTAAVGICEVKNATVQNCTVNGGNPKKK